MVEDIIAILNESEELATLIGDNIYPYTTDYLGNCILYQLIPSSDNGVVNKIRVQFSIIADSLELALQIENIVKRLLITIDDMPLTERVLQVSQNGGGSLYDYNRCKYHHYIYLDIIGRSEVYDC